MFKFFGKKSPAGGERPDPSAPTVDASAEASPATAAVATDTPARQSWLGRLRGGLARSGLGALFGGARLDAGLYDELETALIASDAGLEATQWLLDRLRDRVRAARIDTAEGARAALRELVRETLAPLEKPLELGRVKPLVWMIAGVNGVGKTTSIGKLCRHLHAAGQSVLLAAGDTFRAAAREQLVAWGERNEVAVIAQQGGDPAAVVFDAVAAGRAREVDIVIADTAGRLPSQAHLMEELKKIKRVAARAMEGAPHETLLVIDANNGQNALAQVKAFDDAVGLSGLIITKLDGTARGGILLAIARQRPIPVYFIGVGEGLDDLQPFAAADYADALLA